MKVLYLCSTGSSDATRASVPIHLAVNGSFEVGQETEIILAGDATELVLSETADKIEGLGIPPMRELLTKAKENKVPVYI